MEKHASLLLKYCRVCGGSLGRVSYDCTKYSSELMSVFSVQNVFGVSGSDSEADVASLPQSVCQSCYCTMLRALKAHVDGRPYTHSVNVVVWAPHSEDCSLCAQSGQRGRPKKGKKRRSNAAKTFSDDDIAKLGKSQARKSESS